MTFAEKRKLLADRYFLSAGPLLILVGVGLGVSPLLLGLAGTLLVLATINKIAVSIAR